MSHDLLERLFFLLPAGDVELALIGCESGKLQIVSQTVELAPIGQIVRIRTVARNDRRIVRNDVDKIVVEGARDARERTTNVVRLPLVRQRAVDLDEREHHFRRVGGIVRHRHAANHVELVLVVGHTWRVATFRQRFHLTIILYSVLQSFHKIYTGTDNMYRK